MTTAGRIVIVGATGSSHIGGSLMRAAHKLSIEAELCDVNLAWHRGTLSQRLLWHFGGRRPVALNSFSNSFLELCNRFEPDMVVTTGMAPLHVKAIRACRELGIRCVNYSTDDPFNPQHRARWFLAALKKYDVVFTPRRSNERELLAHGCRRVSYLPFGYDPDLFFPSDGTEESNGSDLFFAGVGDKDRVPYLAAAIQSGAAVRLHGTYWERYPETRSITRGQADVQTIRRGISACRVALCLVRRSNRDGHSMRTFEIPAVGACMIVEDTKEHRNIFGEEEERVIYFRSPKEMVERMRMLLDDSGERARLGQAVHHWIIAGANSYADRLKSMIQCNPPSI